MALKIFVAVATVARADVTRRTIDLLHDQTRRPDGVVVVGAQDSDIAGVDLARPRPELALAERGLCNQRNKALDMIGDRADVIIFFDDDYVAAPDFIAQTERLFETRPGVVGATGDLIADGVHGLGFTVDEALDLIARDRPPEPFELPREALYGCNMVIRRAAAAGLRFDPTLPLYGWQEDIDFTYQLGQRGEMVKPSVLRGVHMGAKGGRSPGKRLGYSQIANPVYLLRKKTIPPKLARHIMWRTLAANLARSVRPEAHIDRRGRALGNLIAIGDLVRGSIHPRRILELS